MNLKGTNRIFRLHLQVNLRQETNTPSMLLRQRRKVLNRLQPSSLKLPTTKRNTPKCGLRRYPEWAQIPLKI